MPGMIRSLGVVALALLSVVALAVTWTAAVVVQLTATALIMGGTGHPLTPTGDDPAYVNRYLDNAVTLFINQAASPTRPGDNPIEGVNGDPVYAVTYPAQFFPVAGVQTFDSSVRDGRGNLSGCVRATSCAYNGQPVGDPPGMVSPTPQAPNEFTVFGYSQSAVVASLVKKDLIANPPANTDVSFFLLANPMRPNGGVLARGPEGLTIPIIGITFYGATPTDSCEGPGGCYETVDVAAQYDGLGGDAPASITNVLAIANAVAGYYYLHGDLQDAEFDDALYQGSNGDTDYYLVPARRLPILMPFESFVPSPILTLLEAPLKAAIEAGYARDVNPGVATKVGLLPFRNPVQAIVNIIRAIPVGIDDAIAEATGDPANRPLGTDEVTSPFGVGGPDLPAPPPAVADGGSAMSLMGDDSEKDIPEQLIPEESVVEGEIVEEGIVEEGETENPEVTTPPAGRTPVTPLGKLRGALNSIRPGRGPIGFGPRREVTPPSATQPSAGQTTTGEPNPDSKDAERDAAA